MGVGGREGTRWGAGDCGAPGLAHGRCEPGPSTRAPPGRGVLRLKTAHRAPATHLMRSEAWAFFFFFFFFFIKPPPSVRLMGSP